MTGERTTTDSSRRNPLNDAVVPICFVVERECVVAFGNGEQRVSRGSIKGSQRCK